MILKTFDINFVEFSQQWVNNCINSITPLQVYPMRVLEENGYIVRFDVLCEDIPSGGYYLKIINNGPKSWDLRWLADRVNENEDDFVQVVNFGYDAYYGNNSAMILFKRHEKSTGK